MKFELVEISEIESFDYDGLVYDLEIDNDHSYNIEGIIVHNSDFVMLGGFLAGSDECEGEWEYETTEIDGLINTAHPDKKKGLRFYGMSSKEAQDKHNGGLSDYKSSEGKCVTVPYKGPVIDILNDITGGIRSCCSYVGCSKIKDLPKCASFIMVNKTHNTVFGQ